MKIYESGRHRRPVKHNIIKCEKDKLLIYPHEFRTVIY